MDAFYQPRTRFFTSQRLTLAAHEWGDPVAPPLILVHGGRDHARSWDRTAARLTRRWRVIAPDLRGHGDSDWTTHGGYPMADLVYDLASLVDQLGPEPLPIIGHSLGGNVAVRYTGTFPERVSRLVSIEGLGFAPALEEQRAATPVGERLRHWIERTRKLAAAAPRRIADLDEGVRRMRAVNPRLDETLARELAAHALAGAEDGDGFAWKHDPRVGLFPPGDISPTELRALWAAIACPVLLIYGDESWASDPEADGRAAHFRNARRLLVQGAGHWVQHDRFEMFIEAVEEFLA